LKTKVAIALLNHNGKTYLQACLSSLLQVQNGNFDIYLIDNASTDDSVAFVQTHFPAVKTICLAANYGFAGGYNKGLQQIEADYYLLLNNDVVAKHDFVTPMLQLIESDRQIAAVQAKLLQLENPDHFEYAGAAGGYLDTLGYPFCRGRVFDAVEKDEGQYNANAPIFWASGACMLIRSTVFNAVGGFYDYLFMQNEDIELCWRVKRAGYKVMACGSASIWHKGGGSLSWNSAQKIFYTFRNNLILLAMHEPWFNKIGLFPIRLLVDSLAAWRFIFAGSFSKGLMVWKAWLAFVYWVVFAKAKANSPTTVTPNKDGRWSGVLVWAYFVQQQKTWRALVNRKQQ
jgi:GT2 family glycosyltransferase